jgi:riboflavin kinase/FMN adenylyltransferase
MTPAAFAKDLLRTTFGAQAVFCGFNFHFGARAQGDPDLLRTLGARAGFETYVTDRVEVNGQPVSSTRIRALIEKGRVEEANTLLGTDFRLTGRIIPGAARGRTIGFPTANFKPNPSMVCPAYGVYVTTAQLDSDAVGEVFPRPLPAVTNIGVKPTVGGTELLAETHIIGYEKDLYGRDLEIAFHRHLRGEKKFDSFENLKHQIAEDKTAAEAYFFK